MADQIKSFSRARHVSKRLILSYIMDWILIIVTAVVGGAFSKIHGAKHAFSLNDPNISFPDGGDTVSNAVLIIVSLLGPAAITAIISLVFVPHSTTRKSTPTALMWRERLWRWNTAWMGLAMTLAGAFMITAGLKVLAGKPRPHLLAICDPDTSPAAIAKYRVGGLGQSLGSAVPIIVDWHICRNTDSAALRDAFASWPSGHASFSWAGMLYLTLFLVGALNIQLPFQSAKSVSTKYNAILHENRSISTDKKPKASSEAAPPVYLLIIAFIPIGVALFISLSRWFDYQHHGFDIISGAFIGGFMAWIGFRWYHEPIGNGAGWAWDARSRDRAFWPGVDSQAGFSEKLGGSGQSNSLHEGDLVTGGETAEQTGVSLNNISGSNNRAKHGTEELV